MSLLDMFSGGAFSNASIFAPELCLTSQLLSLCSFSLSLYLIFKKMQREGESGHKR